MAGSADLIRDVLDENSSRDTIAYGMMQRSRLMAASRFEWGDPREADGVPILAKRKLSSTDLNMRLHVPFDKMISTNKSGYFASDIQVTFETDVPDVVRSYYTSLKDRAKWRGLMLKLANNTVSQGTSFLLLYLSGSELRFALSPTPNTAVVYDELSGEPLYGLRYSDKVAEVYDGMEVTRYERSNGEWMQRDTKLHGLGTVSRPMVPIVEFRNSPDAIGNPERVITICDGYDVSMSDLSNELAALRLSYLLLKGLGERADKVKEQLKDAGVILIDSDNGDARFITKNLNPEAVRLLQDTMRALIFEGASSYDPGSFSEGQSPTAFEVSQRLAALEMDTTITIGEWDNAFRQVDYLIQTYLMAFRGVKEYPLHQIDRIYRRTAPRNMLQALVEARNAGMVLSNQTLIELSGLQIDANEEETRLGVSTDRNNMVDNSQNLVNNDDIGAV